MIERQSEEIDPLETLVNTICGHLFYLHCDLDYINSTTQEANTVRATTNMQKNLDRVYKLISIEEIRKSINKHEN